MFDALVDYIIIGGYENGKKDDCMIRFICKTQFEDDLTKQKITDIFIVASVDYDKKSEETYTFFKIVQNKLHYVIYNKF